MRLLVVEDEKYLNRTISERLSRRGYTVDSCFDGEDALYYIENTQYDGIILDVMMPKINGFDVCKNIKEHNPSQTVLMLTAKGTINDKTQGFDSGADDYIVKPFDIQEVLLRVRALLRRNGTSDEKNRKSAAKEILKVGDIELFPDYLEAEIKGKKIKLTPTEFEIIYCLMQHFGQSVTLAVLLNEVWGYESDEDVRMLRVHVGGLRQKIEENPKHPVYLETVTNVGYKLNPYMEED